jgi:SNF2 family DNA or RNA helicase
MLRGRWVELDRDRLRAMLERFEDAERIASDRGLGFAEAMRLVAGADVRADVAAVADPDWSKVIAGPWLADTLTALRAPGAAAESDPGAALHATLRPYQATGVRWLHLLSRLGLGACLADDMGLGKTIQVLALLLVEQRTKKREPSLLVAPASLLANWAAELERFAPDLRAVIAHPSATPADELATLGERLDRYDLIITSYGALLRTPWLATTTWRHVILDEAQAIKNPGAKQTRAAKQLKGRARIALTGTPIENRLGDLWSIFDFLNPGLLGSAKEFTAYSKRLADRPHNPYGPLRELVRPYILRRLKTDRSVISDLPDKTEVKAYCALTRKQAALYQQAVADLKAQLSSSSGGIKRKGVVLASLMRFKQICNHPSHWLGDGAWDEADSGKWARVRELAEVIAAKQEKALFFTQFREMTAPLAAFLEQIFGRPGLVLHGDTAIARRKDLVAKFQTDEAVPFFVLSLKAGGSGLNLTAASHVVHVDRWWNPAVEDQATDRAFRIGQKKNVLVHKLVCRGTVEDKIDALIESKKGLTRQLLEGGAEINLTEMPDAELLRMVALDLGALAKD